VEAGRRALSDTVDAIEQRPEDGRQYYRMHPELLSAVERKLASGAYRWTGASREELDMQLGLGSGAASGARPRTAG
jgi:hypothetical protein